MLWPSRRVPVRAVFFFVRTLFPRCPRLALDSAIDRPAHFGRCDVSYKKNAKKREAAGPLFLVAIFFFFLIECLFDEMEGLGWPLPVEKVFSGPAGNRILSGARRAPGSLLT